jgi:ABC-type transport system involved in cytochrome c biogenesis ATPase subunit
MAVVRSVNFEDSYRRFKRVDLLHPERPQMRHHETTLITGQNGSHKSSLLKQLVGALVSPPEPDLFQSQAEDGLGHHQFPNQVFCLSGSAADRFPQKELPGGRHSPFDVPHYTYVGQRVANNLLSRKAPLETMLGFALMPRATERYRWQFFADAHTYAGILPSSRYTLVHREVRSEFLPLLQDLQAQLNRITSESDFMRNNKRQFPHVSFAMAQWLLREFSSEDFRALQNLLRGGRRIDVILSDSGAHSEHAAPNVLRLGLLLGILRLQEVQVHSIRYAVDFSALELSSGEYHMFSTILAIGFGLNDDSVLLMDEPENSLHPQWQRDLMGSVFGACSQVMSGGHVIISTHSPLIVGSALQGSTVVDMTSEEPQLSIVSYGASSDELLLNQFGVGSSRNKVVVDKVQLAVSLVERGDFENAEFEKLIPELLNIRDALTDTDPLADVIDALLGEEPIHERRV